MMKNCLNTLLVRSSHFSLSCRAVGGALRPQLHPHPTKLVITRAAHINAKMSKLGHAERTAHEPREPSVHKVILARVDEINPTIRTFRLETASGIRFLPGQWLDVFVPGIERPGGFTITSPPSKARLPPQHDAAATVVSESPYLELAVQKSPDNVVARWLWQPVDAILSSDLYVRAGGSFVWPPPGVMPTGLRKVVFVAGGVGINPLISIVSHLAENPAMAQRFTVEFLYSMRDPGEGHRDPKEMLFLERLAGLFGPGRLQGDLKLFLTTPGGGGGEGRIPSLDLAFEQRRITVQDVGEAIGADKRSAVVYVCGVPRMTDEFVEKLTSPAGLGLEPHKVLYEKWW